MAIRTTTNSPIKFIRELITPLELPIKTPKGKMSTLQTRTRPRLSAFLALFYIFIIFRSSDETVCYIAFVVFFFLIWLHDDGDTRLSRQREEKRRLLVRESLEFRRISPSISGTSVLRKQDEEQEQNEEFTIQEVKGDPETDSLLSSDLESIGQSSSSDIHNIKPVQIGSQESCSICLEPYAVGERVARLKHVEGERRRQQCQHWFHEVCIQKWLQHHNQCPLCRVDMICDHRQGKIETRPTRYGTYSQTSNISIV